MTSCVLIMTSFNLHMMMSLIIQTDMIGNMEAVYLHTSLTYASGIPSYFRLPSPATPDGTLLLQSFSPESTVIVS